MPGQFGGPTSGVSIDTAQALRLAGGHDATVTKIADAIQANGHSLHRVRVRLRQRHDGTDEHYAGQAANATAKAMALFQTLSPARTTIGGINLQSRLEALTAGSGPIAGRSPRRTACLTAGLRQHARSGVRGVRTDEGRFLGGRQRRVDSCSSSSARTVVSGSTFTAARRRRPVLHGQRPRPETDATAIALQQLSRSRATAPITDAKTAARDVAGRRTEGDGSWGGGASTEASNSNSTGLAASALGDTRAVREAAQWLRARQATDYNACDRLAGRRGAIAYDDAALAAGRNNGITADAARTSGAERPRRRSRPWPTSRGHHPVQPVLTGPSRLPEGRLHPWPDHEGCRRR